MSTKDDDPYTQKIAAELAELKDGLADFEDLQPYAVNLPPVEEETLSRFVYSAWSPATRQKHETYNDAVAEQRESGIELIGFDKDDDFTGLNEKLVEVFGQGTLDLCIIEKIIYDSANVLVRDDGDNYLIPSKGYLKLLEAHPVLAHFRTILGTNTAGRNSSLFAPKFLRMPIALYSFEGVDLTDRDYLPDYLTEAEQMRVFKLGTVAHEIAHSIQLYLLDDDAIDEWEDLNASAPSLTSYSDRQRGKSTWHKEQFAEAVRLFVTNRQYLVEKSPEIDQFIETYLPYLKPDGLNPPLSYATQYIRKHGLERKPTHIEQTGKGLALYVSLVPPTESAVVAAEMEDRYRTQANELHEKGKVEEAEQAIRLGRESVERYLREQELQPRPHTVIMEPDLLDNPKRVLEITAQSIREGEAPPIRVIKKLRAYSKSEDGKMKKTEDVDLSRTTYL